MSSSTHARALAASRRGVVAAGLIAVVAAGTPASAHAAASPSGGILVTALALSPQHVSAAGGGATTTLTFTIADGDAGVSAVGGDVIIRQEGDQSGTYVGRAYDVQFAYLNSLSAYGGGADYVSGTPQSSSYKATFVVPQYTSKRSAKWVVTSVDAQDSTGAALAASGTALSRFDHTDWVGATETVDSTAPGYGYLALGSNYYPARPYVYVNGAPGEQTYDFTVQDQQSGFWKGTLTLAGPGGATIDTDFAYVQEPGQSSFDCGLLSGGTDQDLNCAVPVVFPVGTAAGTWTVSKVTVTDNAGNASVAGGLSALPVQVTSDATLSAGGFAAAPSVLDTWVRPQTTQLTFSVAGARQGVSAVYVDDTNGGCVEVGTSATQNADGTYSVPVSLKASVPSCTIDGIAVVDGAGDVALYGSEYGAPDPGVTISRTPDTTPPTVTSASLSQTTIPASQILGGTEIQAVVEVAASVAPVNGFSSFTYDTSGNVVGQVGGGTSMAPDGTVDVPVYLPGGLAPGTYTVGFTLTDAGYLSRSYGTPGGTPVPGGPLTITVTAS